MGEVFGWLAEPLRYPFMRQALAASVLVGVASGLGSTFAVVRGMAFLADALAHAILPGVAVAYLWGGGDSLALFWGGLAAALVAAGAVWATSREQRVREDTAIGVVMAAALALGVAIISLRRTYAVDLAHLLFGNVLGVGPAELHRAAVLAAGLVGLAAAFWRPVAAVCFDPVLAATLGVPVAAVELLLLGMLAVTTVLALQTVGVTMTVAMLVVPGAAARLVARRLVSMAAVSVAVAVGASAAGLYLSYYVGIPSGPATTLVAAAVFAAVRLSRARHAGAASAEPAGRAQDR
ncbi:MAG TPA: metal ABC transporter permease [Limnochordales bacterium]